MSAYIVDNKTISVLAIAFQKYGVKFEAADYGDLKAFVMDLHEVRNSIGQALLNQNYASVNYRYDENDRPYKFKCEEVQIDEGIALGCLRNYEYQACETPDYHETRLHRSLMRLQDKLLDRLVERCGMVIPYGYHNLERAREEQRRKQGA